MRTIIKEVFNGFVRVPLDRITNVRIGLLMSALFLTPKILLKNRISNLSASIAVATVVRTSTK